MKKGILIGMPLGAATMYFALNKKATHKMKKTMDAFLKEFEL